MTEPQALEMAERIPQEMPTVLVHIKKQSSGHVLQLRHRPTTLQLTMYNEKQWEGIKGVWTLLEEND